MCLNNLLHSGLKDFILRREIPLFPLAIKDKEKVLHPPKNKNKPSQVSWPLV